MLYLNMLPNDGLSDPERNQDEFQKWLARHLVTLNGRAEWFRDDGTLLKRGQFTISGFVIIVENFCLWATAGHCLKYLDREIKKGKMRILDSAFGDSYGSEARHTTTIPFSYAPGCGQYVLDDPVGIDFGFIELTWNIIDLLQANKVIAIDERMWRNAHEVPYDAYRVQGVPTS
jgi:hypothetical protein